MGLTPLDGFMMGTRPARWIPRLLPIMEKEGITPTEMDQLLNKQSGILGISGVSSDDRGYRGGGSGNERAKFAWNMRTHEIIKYIGVGLAGGRADLHRRASA